MIKKAIGIESSKIPIDLSKVDQYTELHIQETQIQSLDPDAISSSVEKRVRLDNKEATAYTLKTTFIEQGQLISKKQSLTEIEYMK